MSNGMALGNEEALPDRAELHSQTIDSLLKSGLFDASEYARQLGRDIAPARAVEHYLAEGEQAGLSPSTQFDAKFYIALYDDIASAGLNALDHYVSFGMKEGRYATADKLHTDAALLRRSKKVKLRRASDFTSKSQVPGLSLLEYNIAAGWRKGAAVLEGLDDRFYFAAYEDVRTSGLSPALHYLLAGREEGRFTRLEQIASEVALLRPHFDEEHYRSQLPDLPEEIDPVADYILSGRANGIDPSPDFSVETYLGRYPDIIGSGIDPFLHFIQFGRAEGRSGNVGSFELEPGDQPLDPDRPTFLVAAHESSRTGAPLVALGVAEELAKENNVIVLTGRPGPLSPDFKAVATQVGTGSMLARGYEQLLRTLRDEGRLDGAVLNSVETFQVSEGALHASLPSVALIHEFAEYSDYRVRRMVGTADRVVFPAQLLSDSAHKELSLIGQPNNTTIRHQGVLTELPSDLNANDLTLEDLNLLLSDGNATKVVLGAGYVQIRKGVDLFVQAAAEVRNIYPGKFKFLWVGSGYDPVRDLNYSLYVRETLERLDLLDVVIFLPAQASLDILLDRADLFFLPSRMDPFPNVALDAFEAGLPLVCFNAGTGIAEEITSGRAVGAAVEFGSTAAAARAIVDFFGKPRSVADPNRQLMNDAYKFSDYGKFIVGELAKAKTLRSEIDRVVLALDEAKVFDAAFHEGKRTATGLGLRPLRHYVSAGLKGLSDRNPKPGFSDNVYRSQHGIKPGTSLVPLFDAVMAGERQPTTHDCRLLVDDAPFKPFRGRVALHLHLFYSDLAFDFARRLAGAGARMDIVVSTNTDKKRSEIEYAFANYRRGSVRVIVVPNRGRDMGPLITSLRDVLRDGEYEVIGHLHGKKSLTAFNEPTSTGDRWREHMVGLLMGDGRRMDQVLSLFGERNTGLVFAEDRNSVGWTENLPLAEELARRMTPVPSLPSYPYFPMGAMFWARREALEPFWTLGLTPDDLPSEPLPYDRTILHTVERMLPAVCESVGLEWRTVHAHGAGW